MVLLFIDLTFWKGGLVPLSKETQVAHTKGRARLVVCSPHDDQLRFTTAQHGAEGSVGLEDWFNIPI